MSCIVDAGVSMVAHVTDVSLTFLGTGTSVGVPVIGCDCAVCTSDRPQDKRFRSSVLFRAGDQTLLVDSGPDLRMQALREGLRKIDAVLYTHAHADHILGIDDLRQFNWISKRRIPIYAPAQTMETIRTTFPYVFQTERGPATCPDIAPCSIDDAPFEIGGETIIPLPAQHGPYPVTGYRIRDFAYLTDVNFLPDETREKMRGLEFLILGALKEGPHTTHFSVEEAIVEAQKIGAKKTALIHMTHSVLHAELEPRLPEGIVLAYDGMVLDWGT